MKNLRFFLSSLLLLLYTLTSAQEIGCTKHIVISAKMNFEEDLKKGKITIYLQGGIVSVIKNEDHQFEQSYGIAYHDFGCVVPGDFKYYQSYNHYAFEYLKEKYGTDWQKKMNSNAFGWNTWTKV